MSIKKTPVLGLPQWEWNEHPSFVLDMNPAFEAIDSFAGTADSSIKELKQWKSDTSPIITQHGNDIATLQADMSDQKVQMVNVKSRLSTAESNISADQGNITSLQGRVKTLEDDNVVQNGALVGFDALNTVQKEFNDSFKLQGWKMWTTGKLIGQDNTDVYTGIQYGFNHLTGEIFIGTISTTSSTVSNALFTKGPHRFRDSVNPTGQTEFLQALKDFGSHSPLIRIDTPYDPIYAVLDNTNAELAGLSLWQPNITGGDLSLIVYGTLNTSATLYIIPSKHFRYIF